jgi:hypothetical protein
MTQRYRAGIQQIWSEQFTVLQVRTRLDKLNPRAIKKLSAGARRLNLGSLQPLGTCGIRWSYFFSPCSAWCAFVASSE